MGISQCTNYFQCTQSNHFRLFQCFAINFLTLSTSKIPLSSDDPFKTCETVGQSGLLPWNRPIWEKFKMLQHWPNHVCSNQCGQMARSFDQYLAAPNNENLPKLVQNFAESG